MYTTAIKKLNCQDHFFMGRAAITESLKFFILENSRGFDRIPQRILTDGADVLIDPLTGLFDRIYHKKRKKISTYYKGYSHLEQHQYQ
jgi:hypothetical protein